MNLQDAINNVGTDRTTMMALTMLVIFLPLGFIAADAQFDVSTRFSLAGSTACIDGVSDVYIDSNVREFEGNDAWRVEFTNGCNEKIAGGGADVSQEELQTEGVQANTGFDMRLTDFEAYYRQGIDRTDPQTLSYNWDYKVFLCANLYGCNDNDIQEAWNWVGGNENGGIVTRSEDIGGGVILAWKRQGGQAEVYDWSSDSGPGFNGQISLCANGDCASDTISRDNPVANIQQGDREAQVRWEGSRIGEISDVDFSNVRPIETPRGNIKLISSQEYQDYRDTVDDIEQCMKTADLRKIDYKDTNLIECTQPATDAAAVAARDSSSTIENSLSYIDGQVETSQNEVRLVADGRTAIERPVFVATIDSDWVGVVEKAPKPEIGAIRSFDMREGSSVEVRVPVTNLGNSPGNIRVNTQCGTPISAGSMTKNVEAGQTGYFDIRVNSGNGEGTYTCDVTARASGTDTAQARDQSSFQIKLRDGGTNCPDCVGEGEDGGETVVKPPSTGGIAWGKVALVVGILTGIAGSVYYIREKTRWFK